MRLTLLAIFCLLACSAFAQRVEKIVVCRDVRFQGVAMDIDLNNGDITIYKVSSDIYLFDESFDVEIKKATNEDGDFVTTYRFTDSDGRENATIKINDGNFTGFPSIKMSLNVDEGKYRGFCYWED